MLANLRALIVGLLTLTVTLSFGAVSEAQTPPRMSDFRDAVITYADGTVEEAALAVGHFIERDGTRYGFSYRYDGARYFMASDDVRSLEMIDTEPFGDNSFRSIVYVITETGRAAEVRISAYASCRLLKILRGSPLSDDVQEITRRVAGVSSSCEPVLQPDASSVRRIEFN